MTDEPANTPDAEPQKSNGGTPDEASGGAESAGRGSASASNEAGGGASNIHVDADWKREAQAEKERLAKEADEAAAQAAEAGDAAAPPEANFEVLVQQLAGQAALFLSDQPDPRTGQSLQRLDLAKHMIDLLGVLEEKTRGNLTDQERRLIDAMLYELRMAYVSAAS